MKTLINKLNKEIRLSFPDDCLQFNPTNNCWVSKCSQPLSYAKDLWHLEKEESEDERIRKEIIDFLKSEKAFQTIDLPISERWIAYLEKQKEQTENEREYVRTLKSLISDLLRGKQEVDTGYYQKIYDWLDGRCIEQKPSTPEDIAAAYQMRLADGKKEHKPAEWSEKDEKISKRARGCILSFACGPLDEMSERSYYEEILNWFDNRLKFLRPQPKQEWSEEDEKMLSRIIHKLDDLGYEEFCKSSRDQDVPEDREYFEEIEWLKSLRPRYNQNNNK